jgi:EAL domain-containing protein (putative c-di-GMP-specific phosphodiesterase class I)
MLTTYKKDSSNRLLEVVNSIREEPNDYTALQLNFSDLLEHYKTDYQQKISINIIIDLLRGTSGSVLVLQDYDIFVVCKNADKLKIKKLIFQLRYLYMDDPLAYDDFGEDNPKFATIYELEKEWMSFYSAVRAKIKQLGLSKTNKIIATTSMLTAEKLNEIESSIGKFNIAPALRQQPICHSKNDDLRIMFTETYINISALAEILHANVDFASNRWLFKHFTNLLDLRVIELLKKSPAKYVRKPVSLNFNVQTILSNIFTEFAANLDVSMRKNMVIEIQVIDIFADMQAFRTARDILQSQGFRLCLDGMDALSFRQLDRSSLGFDLAKMYWNADLTKDLKSEQNLRLKDAIEDCGKARVILCRCDTKEAIDYGKSLGISLFQGRYIDEQIDPSAEILN